MKILKIAGIVILAVVALVFILGLFARKEYHVERAVTINKPKAEVFGYVKQLRRQNDYNIWAQKDPNMKATFTGTDGMPGFVSAWEGNSEAGKGAQEIRRVVEGERIETELRFEKPMKSVAQAFISTAEAGPAQTKVTWGFTGKMPYPLNTMMLFMNMDKMMGKDMEQSLGNLKGILEKQ